MPYTHSINLKDQGLGDMLSLKMSVGSTTLNPRSYGSYSPYSLFSTGENGVWLDPSDLTTMFQNTAGTVPVTAAGQPVGLILDKSKNLVLGPEIIDINNLPTPTIGNLGGSNGVWTPATRTMSNTAVGTSAFLPRFQFNFGLTVGATYKISGLLSGNLSSMFVICTVEGSGNVISYNSSTGVISGVFVATTPNIVFVTDGRSLYNIKIESLSLQLLAGNHAYLPSASSTACRPTYQVSGGFSYLSFDGVDDFLVTGPIAFNTDALTILAGVRKNSDAARGVILELGASVDANTGSFSIEAPNGAGAQYLFRSKGTLEASAQVTTGYSAPVTNVFSAQSKIGTDLASMRLNMVSAASSASDQGTGNYSSAVLNIGRRDKTTLPFNGRLYQLIVRNTNTTDAVLANSEIWVNSRTGAF